MVAAPEILEHAGIADKRFPSLAVNALELGEVLTMPTVASRSRP